MIKAVIFDLDNTLYDYDFCNEIAEKELLATISNCLKVDASCSRELLFKAKKEVKKQLGNVAAAHNRLLYFQKVCEFQGVNPLQYALDFYNVYWNRLLGEMKLFTYVRPLFYLLHEKEISVGILTDLTVHIQYRKLERLGIVSDVNHITTSEEVGHEKPSVQIYRKMLSKVQCRPEEALMIGDSLEKDVRGAQAVGMWALLFNKDLDVFETVKNLL